MDKKAKGKPRLRKEDIGKPVNFVHVKHVGFGQKNSRCSASACASPTYMAEPFFDKSFRLSDQSMHGQVLSGKENQVSNEVVLRPSTKPPVPPYSSMSNLSIAHQREIGAENRLSRKQSFSGSLLNLNLFRRAERPNSRYETGKSKRMSLGMLQTSFSPQTPPVNGSLAENCIPEIAEKSYVRRRSSSFTTDADYNVTFENRQDSPQNNRNSKIGQVFGLVRSNSTVSAWIKKPKLSRQPSQVSPPMSPSYDELPPPPEDIFFPSPQPLTMLPETSYGDLPPPPPKPVRLSLRRQSSELSERPLSLPAPPSPPTALRKVSLNSELANLAAEAELPEPPEQIHLETEAKTFETLPSKIPVIKGSPLKVPAWRSRAIRVNAPTLPPLSIPLIKQPQRSPLTPPSWPLEPPLIFEQNEEDSELNYESSDIPQSDTPSQGNKNPSEMASPNFRKPVDRLHLEPLSALMQSKIPYQKWPAVMNQLFTKFPNTKNSDDTEVQRIYGELVTKTLELWLELGDGNASFEEVVMAVEQAQAIVESDSKSTSQ